MRNLKKIYMSEGHPTVIQTDCGTEFRGAQDKYCSDIGIKRIVSSPYHQQSQGKVESSHRSWKNKFRFDVRKSNYTFTNWVSRLGQYASLYNRQQHSSLGTSPFHVYHGKKKTLPEVSRPTSCTISNSVAQWLEGVKEVRAEAKKASEKSQGKMVEKHSKKHQPSCYVSGDSVLVMLTKENKIKKARIVKGTVLKDNYAKHRYYVKHSDGVG